MGHLQGQTDIAHCSMVIQEFLKVVTRGNHIIMECIQLNLTSSTVSTCALEEIHQSIIIKSLT
jgi:hypothetical protein